MSEPNLLTSFQLLIHHFHENHFLFEPHIYYDVVNEFTEVIRCVNASRVIYIRFKA